MLYREVSTMVSSVKLLITSTLSVLTQVRIIEYIHPDFFVNFVFEISVAQQTRTRPVTKLFRGS